MELFLELLALYAFCGVVNVIINNDILDLDRTWKDLFFLGLVWPATVLLWIAAKLGFIRS